MLITEISNKTGISKKAIYLYESKGLLKVSRQSNGYRFYDENDIKKLRRIKLLRMAGISIADIKLLFEDIVTLDDIVKKRKTEINSEYGCHSGQMQICRELITRYKNNDCDTDEIFEENISSSDIPNSNDILSVGIDIGTTTISMTIINLSQNSQVEFYTLPNKYSLLSANPDFHEQDADLIYEKSKELLDNAMNIYPNIKSIGITGQMHGILYIDKNGNAVSPFFTWQDKRADIECCKQIYTMTGEKLSPGFGYATHYKNILSGFLPKNANTFCNIADYIAEKLSGNNMPIIHSSVAASFGMFDIKNNCFKTDKIILTGMDKISLPFVTDDFYILGSYRGAAISVAIGDNQACFLGSADNLDDCVLVNIGTGSQISAVCNTETNINETGEIRPLFKGKNIFSGSALCGGAAYALLKNFFENFISDISTENFSLYEKMNDLAYNAYISGKQPLTVDTRFRGSRSHSETKGSILNITDKNFTPDRLILGFIYGICNELYNLLPSDLQKKNIIASGNAVRKNKVFPHIITEVFNMPVNIPVYSEEASVGAALFSAVSAGLLKNPAVMGKFIKYRRNII